MDKVYVAVRADFRDDGAMLPREITWEHGRRYEIDRGLISGRLHP